MSDPAPPQDPSHLRDCSRAVVNRCSDKIARTHSYKLLTSDRERSPLTTDRAGGSKAQLSAKPQAARPPVCPPWPQSSRRRRVIRRSRPSFAAARSCACAAGRRASPSWPRSGRRCLKARKRCPRRRVWVVGRRCGRGARPACRSSGAGRARSAFTASRRAARARRPAWERASALKRANGGVALVAEHAGSRTGRFVGVSRRYTNVTKTLRI